MADITSTEKKRRFLVFCLLGLAVAVGIVLVSFLLFAPSKIPSTTTIATPRSESVSGQAGGEGSEEYNKKLETHDQQKASAALTSGESDGSTSFSTQLRKCSSIDLYAQPRFG